MTEEDNQSQARTRDLVTIALARADGHRWTHVTEARREVIRAAYAARTDAVMTILWAMEDLGFRGGLMEALAAIEDLYDIEIMSDSEYVKGLDAARGAVEKAISESGA